MNLLGTKVYIKANSRSWNDTDWGIIRSFDGEYYHIGMFGDQESTVIFTRSEFRVPRPKKYII